MMALGALVAFWLLSGIYMVGADQMGVVMRFGAFHRTELPVYAITCPRRSKKSCFPLSRRKTKSK
jgi:regulator of protease activity HflC (stomatin/prohibitin superfamily)